MLEKEVKIMLSEEEYEKAAELFDFGTPQRQVNNYYYSPECAAHGISVRVREVKGEVLLQVKVPISTDGSLAVREEIERKLHFVPDRIGAETLNELVGVTDEAVLKGSLETMRRICVIDKTEISLDKNTYLGTVDYEIELEYEGDYPQALVDKLAEAGITADKPQKSKLGRFLKRLECQNCDTPCK